MTPTQGLNSSEQPDFENFNKEYYRYFKKVENYPKRLKITEKVYEK